MSAKRLIEDTIRRHVLKEPRIEGMFRVLNTHIETSKGGIVLFQGMSTQTEESIKSLEGFSLAWIEEAQSLSQRSLNLLRPTIREEGSEIFASWNPRYPTDPIDRLLWADKSNPEAIVVHTTYRDNPFFPEVLRKEMEWDRSRDPEKYAHVWLGEYERHSEARVFKNFRIEEFDTPDDTTFYYGGDWGYSVDPTVLVRCFIKGRNLYIDREAYRVGLEIDHTPQFFREQIPGCEAWPITADSARPETISFLKRHGFPRIKAAIKGKDSVKEGIIFLQGYDIVIHPRCVHTADEFTMYSYKVDKMSGLVVPELEDKKNHVIDSVRYAVEDVRKPTMGLTW